MGEVSRLDNTDGMLCMGLSHLPDLPDGVFSNIILQDSVIVVATILITIVTVSATCNYYNTDNI